MGYLSRACWARHVLLTLIAALAPTVLPGCGGHGPPPPAPPPAAVTIDAPKDVTTAPGATHQFHATVTGMSDTAVTWSVEEAAGGSVDSSGLYTAPGLSGTYHVRATSNADAAAFDRATVDVSGSGLKDGVWVNYTGSNPCEMAIESGNPARFYVSVDVFEPNQMPHQVWLEADLTHGYWVHYYREYQSDGDAWDGEHHITITFQGKTSCSVVYYVWDRAADFTTQGYKDLSWSHD